tara:strand:- start:1952 stop:2098 length:147 start_codon:yes stop_codon:yes gene_type:complete
MKKNIRTVCGLEKYDELCQKKGFFNRIRFFWFVFAASVRDLGKNRNAE